MRRPSVRSEQIDACIKPLLFANSFRPQTPELYAGEPLLLQLDKDEACKQGRAHARSMLALIFDQLEALDRTVQCLATLSTGKRIAFHSPWPMGDMR
jgi:hypothetical protein